MQGLTCESTEANEIPGETSGHKAVLLAIGWDTTRWRLLPGGGKTQSPRAAQWGSAIGENLILMTPFELSIQKYQQPYYS